MAVAKPKKLPDVAGVDMPGSNVDMAKHFEKTLNAFKAPPVLYGIPDYIAAGKPGDDLRGRVEKMLSVIHEQLQDKSTDDISASALRHIGNVLEESLKIHYKAAELQKAQKAEAEKMRTELKTRDGVLIGTLKSMVMEKFNEKREAFKKDVEQKQWFKDKDTTGPDGQPKSAKTGIMDKAKGGALGALSSLMPGTLSHLKTGVEIAAVAGSILAMAGTFIDGWLASQRTGAGKFVSIASSILAGSNGTNSWLQNLSAVGIGGYSAYKLGSLGFSLGATLGGGNPVAAFAGMVIGASLGAAGVYLAQQMGPDRLAIMMQGVVDRFKAMLDSVLGTSMVIDKGKIAAKSDQITEQMKGYDTIIANEKEKLDKLKDEQLAALTAGQTAVAMQLSKDIENSKKVIASLEGANRDLAVEMGVNRDRMITAHLRDIKALKKTIADAGITDTKAIDALIDNLVKDQAKQLAEIEARVKAARTKVGLPDELKRTPRAPITSRQMGITADKAMREQEDRLQAERDKAITAPKSPEAPKPPDNTPTDDWYDKNYGTPKPNKISYVQPEVTGKDSALVKALDRSAKATQVLAKAQVNASMVQINQSQAPAPAPARSGGGGGGGTTNIFTSIDPRATSDEMIRRLTLGWA